MAFRCVVEKGRVTFGATSTTMLEHHLEAKTEVLPDGTIRATVIIPGRKHEAGFRMDNVEFLGVVPPGAELRKVIERDKQRRKKSGNRKASHVNR